MDFQSTAIREASRAGDYGRVIRLVRQGLQMTQTQLGAALGMSQPAVHRLENRGTASYITTILAAAAAHLHFAPELVGLSTGQPGSVTGVDDVNRRKFLAGATAAVAAPSVLAARPEAATADAPGGSSAALRLPTAAYRRLDGTTPSHDLKEAVRVHLQLVQTVASNATDPEERKRLAAVGSEASSLAGWLAWDMGDHGSARAMYGSSINAARSSGNALLVAYQRGTLAQFEAHTGNHTEALNLTRRARRALGDTAPPVADAWLSSVEALAHAAAGDQRAADRALISSRAAAVALPAETPPWPWVFAFSPDKVAATRVTCGARLGLAHWVLGDDVEALTTGHTKQRALLVLDIAAGHLAAGHVDTSFALAARALETGVRYRSGRIVERARVLRRSLTTTSPPKVVRDFDEQLHGVYL
ncbi:multiprotein-bridging factor 1 family protein [Streptomyces sp. NPDC059639]|uniref:helix-turn-helix domain-containing protein n=1 Tax=Streptomyces sp. NPDC059639 TaxID=3346891 RepID=UPI0036D065BB